MRRALSVVGCLVVALCGISFSQTDHSEYRIARKIHLEGEGGWDYLTMDDATGRLFVSHATMVQVVDVREGKVIGTIPDTKGVHGIALARDINKGFISNGRDTSVTVFDLATLNVLARVRVTGNNPDAVLYDQFTQKVFTFNGRSSNATVIDARTNAVLGTIPLSGKPEFAVTDGKGKVFVNIEDKSEVCLINPVTLKVEHTWPIAPGEGPSGLAIDVRNNRLFAVCDNKMMIVLNAADGSVVATVPIGERVDGVAFDPGKMRAYSSNGDGTLTVVQESNENTFKVLENVATQRGARTIAVDITTHHIYIPTAEFGPPPEPTADNPHPRPVAKPNTFVVIDVEPVKHH